ncbi:MAG: hypothetical protein GY707_15255, partial [Desulfobacteraceae bacterium]|nr:hypothetical protein [Desulfobacteraceae bacterium]
VIKGRNRGGSQLGFPTANIKLHDELCPKFGVYAVKVECSEGIFQGVANIGYSPTFDVRSGTLRQASLSEITLPVFFIISGLIKAIKSLLWLFSFVSFDMPALASYTIILLFTPI